MVNLMKVYSVLCTFVLIVVVDITADRQWGRLSGAALDTAGNVYVIDATYVRVIVLDGTGNVLYHVPYNSTQPHMYAPSAHTVDAHNNLFVLDDANFRSPTIHSFADGGRRYIGSAQVPTEYSNGQCISADNAGHLYLDTGTMFSPDGTVLMATMVPPNYAVVSITSNGAYVYVLCYLLSPTTNATIRVFDNQGNFKQQWNLSDSIPDSTLVRSVADDRFVYYINRSRLVKVSIQDGAIVSTIPFINVLFDGKLAINGTDFIAAISNTRSVITIATNSGTNKTFTKPDPVYFKYPTTVIPRPLSDQFQNSYYVLDGNHIRLFDLFGLIKVYELSFVPNTFTLDGSYLVLSDTDNARIVRIRTIDGVQTDVFGGTLLPTAQL